MGLDQDFEKSEPPIERQLDTETAKNIAAVVDAIYDTSQNMRVRTVVKNPRQHVALARLHLYAEKFGSEAAKMCADYLEELAVSEGRGGRNDVLESLKAILTGTSANDSLDEMKRNSFIGRLLGR